MAIQRVRSKQAKTNALLGDPGMRQFIPDTRAFSREALSDMLEQYGMVYVKPVVGTFGNGVIRVERLTDVAEPYRFQAGLRKSRFAAFEGMLAALLAAKRPRPYIVQQGIELLKYDGRRFDLRLMIQRNPKSQWETTGWIGRLAHPRKIVTNYHSGGTPMPVERLLEGHLSGKQQPAFLAGLAALGTWTAAVLEKTFPRLQEIGIDVAVDESLKPWILEVNTLPDPYLFRKLPDPAVFRRIYRYAVAYGRFRKQRRKTFKT